MSTYGPNVTGNSYMINTYIVAGATLDSYYFRSVLNDLNTSGNSMGLIIGNSASYSGIFSPDKTLIENIVIGYSSAISYYNYSSAQGINLSGGTISVNRYTAGSTSSDNYGFGANNLSALNTIAHDNIAFGSNALAGNTSGNYNLALGTSSLRNNTTGSNNIAIGYSSLNNN
jgi:hypothetical protein